MTICLGALCAGVDGSEAAAVVAASDRMVTMGGVTEFEHEVPKVTQIGDRIVALAAGDALRGERLVNELRGYLQQGAQPLQSIAATAAAPVCGIAPSSRYVVSYSPYATVDMASHATVQWRALLPYPLNRIHSLVTSCDAVGDPDSFWTGED
jgi:hypothetical protein